jgi:hypothetical protein
MASIYLINVGANVADQAKARSPLFPDGHFEYVSFPDEGRTTRYPNSIRRFVREGISTTHLDPDWDNLTYGDFCKNSRARALTNVEPKDILLFWGLLWRLPTAHSDVWATKDRGWYLMGAMRVKLVLTSGQSIKSLPPNYRERVRHNDHVYGDRVEGREHVRVFLADQKYSRKFRRAVDLQVYANRSLLTAVIRTADGRKIQWYQSPRWNSVTRACRAVLCLAGKADTQRAHTLRDAIRARNPDFDLLADL